jgi:hydrogenase maturation protein HypF
MLAYSPLHHLLLQDTGAPLVMTSGNVSDEPIAYRDEDALARLTGIADLFLVHDRSIETRTDDSVVRVVGASGSRRTALLRRSRGFVPASLPLPGGGTPRQVLACGAELKNTFCLAKGGRAWVSHHIGDLENFETLQSFTEGIEHFKELFDVDPEVVVYDLHPDYLSTKYAVEQEGVELVGVQHHHAHLAACLAEHAFEGQAVGAIYDGTGYGTDATVWGGELLVGATAQFERAGSLWPVRMPGGAAAIREPWRMACAWLSEAFGEPQPVPPPLLGRVEQRRWDAVARLAAAPELSPVTSSMGRLFDGVSALCGIRATVNYEGQAAIEFEALATGAASDGSYRLEVIDAGDGRLTLDPRRMLRTIVRDLARDEAVGVIAARFHDAVAQTTAHACAQLAARRGTDAVALSGGVFQNRLLLDGTAAALRGAGLRILVPERLPVNDGGVSFGQVAVAAARLRKTLGG